MKNLNIAVVGAGMTGLLIAHQIRNLTKHTTVTLFEKSRGVGGRVATRRNATTTFDHGAQYFTARSPSFKEFLQPLIHEGLIAEWSSKYVLFDNTNIIKRGWPTNEPRFVGIPSMNAIAKHLASFEAINKNTLIQQIVKDKNWTLIDSNNNKYTDFDWVIITIPPEQALQILAMSVPLLSQVSTIKMTPCFSVMLELSQPLESNFDCAHIKNHEIGWIALNHTKPGRTPSSTLIVQSSAEFSQKFINHSKESVLEHLITKTADFITFDKNTILHKDIHLWRYANNTDFSLQKTFIDDTAKIAVAGDFCEGGRIEGAYLSAHKTTAQIVKLL